MKFDIWLFPKYFEKYEVSLKSDKNNECFTWSPIHIFNVPRSVILRMRNVEDKSRRENHIKLFVPNNVLKENHSL
jgi:hypothetical protein